MTTKNIIYYLSIGLIIAISSYLGGIYSVISYFISIIVYGSFFFIFYFLFHKIRKTKKILEYKIFLFEFMKKISLSFVIIILFLSTFAYYQNNIEPAKMPQFTITNGDKTVVFQSMSHIGTQDFYNKVRDEIIKYKKNNFVYFYEGVKPGNKKNTKDFNKALGIKFDKELYKNFSKLYGVTNQDNSLFMGLVNNKDFNVDLSLDEIMKIYNSKIKNTPKQNIKKQLPKEVVDINDEIIKILSKADEKELKIIIFINKSLLNLIVKNDNIQNALLENFSNKTLFDVILNQRNKNIVENIYSNPAKNIITTYGLLHFKGVLNLLKQKDSKWKIKSIKYFYPIK